MKRGPLLRVGGQAEPLRPPKIHELCPVVHAVLQAEVDLNVIVSKRNKNSSVILLMPKEREWNL